MSGERYKARVLSDSDINFIVREAGAEFRDKEKLGELVREDESFRNALVSDERLFRRVVADEEIFVKISSLLYFEVLLRHTLKELETAKYTVEKIGGSRVPVFDTLQVVKLLNNDDLLWYLADMLASFTRTESFTLPVRVRKGIWRRIRFSDIDIDALSRFGSHVPEEQRFRIYKRIADICLFIPGIFPEYTYFNYPQPFSAGAGGEPGARIRGRRGLKDYEETGREFCRLAAAHPTAKILEMSAVFNYLNENFAVAWKPLNFLTQHYLKLGKTRLFGLNA